MKTKIEIELQYLDELRESVNKLQLENRELKKQTKSYKENILYENATNMAKKLFELLVAEMFKSMDIDIQVPKIEDIQNRCGFSQRVVREIITFDYRERIDTDNNLYEFLVDGKLDMFFSIEQTNKFRQAFLNLGIKKIEKESE